MVADAGQREIGKCYKFLVNVVGEKVEVVTPASLVRRFCAVLGLGVREMKAAEEMARAAVPSEDSTRPVPHPTHLSPLVTGVSRDLAAPRKSWAQSVFKLTSCNTVHTTRHCRGVTCLGLQPQTFATSCRPETTQLRPWDGKSPASVAGAVIYAVCSLPKAEKQCSALEIAQVGHTAPLPVGPCVSHYYAWCSVGSWPDNQAF